MPFAQGSILVKPNNKTAFSCSWENTIQRIKILGSHGICIFDCGSYNFPKSGLIEGNSLSLADAAYKSSKPNPGIFNGAYFYSDKLILYPGDSCVLSLVLHDKNNQVESIRLYYSESTIQETLRMDQIKKGEYQAVFKPNGNTIHGESIIAQYGSNRLVIRYLENNPKSAKYQKVLINEIIAEPKKDYSGGQWSGKSGNGVISDTDDFI